MIENILQESMQNKSLVGLNYYGSDNAFYCGYVLEYNEEFLILQHYSKFGVADGLLIHKLGDIKYVEKETEYLKGMKLLIENKDSAMQQKYKLKKGRNHVENFTMLLESMIGNRDHLIKFELNDGDLYFGFIEWCDEDSFSIVNVDIDGLTGKAVFKLEDVKCYWIYDLECRKRAFIHKTRNSKK